LGGGGLETKAPPPYGANSMHLAISYQERYISILVPLVANNAKQQNFLISLCISIYPKRGLFFICTNLLYALAEIETLQEQDQEAFHLS